MMFGYACNETVNYIPVSLDLSHALVKELAAIRREGKVMTYLRPDAKSQITIEYNENNKPERVHTIVISTQHDDFIKPSESKGQERADREMLEIIREDVKNILIPRVKAKVPQFAQLIKDDYILYVNPTGKFVIGGPHGDTGLTGRKIIVDTYGGKGAHGGGAFSGKDPSKVDRSAAYAARHIAKNLVAAGIADEVLVQVAYAIGIAEPMNIYINTYGTAHVSFSDSQIAEKVNNLFDMRPRAIEKRLKLRNPSYEEPAAYGHVGRTPVKKEKTFFDANGKEFTKTVELFTWEKLDKVAEIKEVFDLK
jgi:S-adenosylmethionine synthetase